jgi:putative transcriptional regulator
MTIETMVRSRLKLLLSERNTERLRSGQEPLTIRELAELADLSPSVISGLTSNRIARIDFTTLDKICKALDCQPGDILVRVPDHA